jgi:GTP diphosphokinase / guanosine-3',5'-bis(diphosphate) 3'-diphosphatase
MKEPGLLLAANAADFAARRHVNQRRKGRAGEPYINHLAEVAMLLAAATDGSDPALVAAGFLHDTLEDTPTDYDELVSRFGTDVADLVAAVTDDKSLPKAERKRLQVEQAPKKSVRARLLKLADKISNVRSLATSPPADWDLARALDYVDWAEAVVAGCRGINATLEHLFDAAAAESRAAISRR